VKKFFALVFTLVTFTSQVSLAQSYSSSSSYSSSRTSYDSNTYLRECGPDYFSESMDRWEIEKERQEKRGRKRAVIGSVIGIAGIILGSSNDGTTRTVGGLMQIGGVTLIALGLVDLASSSLSLPGRNSNCRDYYVSETRMVTYEEQECRTTQFTEHGWGSSRSYYEVQCESHTYVTYEQDFQPWQRGRPYRYGY
jgi:hypothetical protein